MRCSTTALVLATLAAQAFAGTVGHAHRAFHAKKTANPFIPVEKRQSSVLTAADSEKLLTTLAFTAIGQNAFASNGNAWIGTDGPYTNEYTNDSGEDLILVVWGSDGSWVNAVQPLITVSLVSGASTTLSFANGAIGAWSAIYADTAMVDGQISNTWGEYTFSDEGVVDVSREVNMSGHTMSIVGPQCTTNMDTCVFTCASGNTCMIDYLLVNCENGSQAGANYGTYGGYPSGGCGGMGSGAALTTTLS